MTRGALLAACMLLAACALLTSCGTAVPMEDGGPPRVEVGIGESYFTALADGADVELVRGPQGGYHVFVAVRATSLPVDVHLHYEVRDESDITVLTMPNDELLGTAGVQRSSTGWSRAGDRAIFATVTPTDVAGRTLHLHVVVTCPCGTFEDARTLHVTF